MEMKCTLNNRKTHIFQFLLILLTRMNFFLVIYSLFVNCIYLLYIIYLCSIIYPSMSKHLMHIFLYVRPNEYTLNVMHLLSP